MLKYPTGKPMIMSGKFLDALRDFSDEGAVPDVLYHYTDAVGIRGILSSGKLWATHIDYLNDSSELLHGQAQLSYACSELLKDAVHPHVRTFLTHFMDPGQLRPLFVYFIASFCEQGDLLSQWRAYGGNDGGYAVGINIKNGSTAVRVGGGEHLVVSSVVRVNYDVDKQRERFKAVLAPMAEAIEKTIPVAPVVTEKADLDLPEWQSWLSGYSSDMADATLTTLIHLQTTLVASKSPSFSEEEEWRLICFLPAGRNTETSRKLWESVKFRTVRGVLIPFVELQLQEDGKLPLASCVVGPSTESDRAHQSLRLLMDLQGYAECPIQVSPTPFRW